MRVFSGWGRVRETGCRGAVMRNRSVLYGLFGLFFGGAGLTDAGEGWRSLPLMRDGKVDPAWAHIGYGGFVVDDGVLRTECDERGLGLLVYTKDKFGDCHIKVVYKAKDAKSNSGV